jgi:transposase-like protein
MPKNCPLCHEDALREDHVKKDFTLYWCKSCRYDVAMHSDGRITFLQKTRPIGWVELKNPFIFR